MSGRIINSPASSTTHAAHAHLRAWALTQFDAAVSDIFGYHAMQLGQPHWPTLRNSRIPHHFVANSFAPDLTPQDRRQAPVASASSLSLLSELTALPFAENSLDLITLPLTLECSSDPHSTLREVARVLRPEGKVVVCGINPWSLWARQNTADIAPLDPQHPHPRQRISLWRLRDWMRLLGWDIESTQLGCYRPAWRKAQWYERMAWMDKLGPRLWPILSGAYVLVASKRVHGMRLLEPRWKNQAVPVRAGSVKPVASGSALQSRPSTSPGGHNTPRTTSTHDSSI